MPRQATLASIPTWYNPNLAPPYPAYGQVIYDVPGTYSWTCPAGVVEVSVVCIGGGGSGGAGRTTYTVPRYYPVDNCSGGGGGGLGYRRFRQGGSSYNQPLVPGNTYTVVVGKGGYSTTSQWAPSSGGISYFKDLTTCSGWGGAAGASSTTAGQTLNGGTGGTYYGDGGGNGADGGFIQNASSLGKLAGGGGAGGYGYTGGKGGAYYVIGSTIQVNQSLGYAHGQNATKAGAGGAMVDPDIGPPSYYYSPGNAGHGGGSSLFGNSFGLTTTYGGDYYGGGNYWGDDGDSYISSDDISHRTTIGKNTVDGVYYAGWMSQTYGSGSGGDSYLTTQGNTGNDVRRGSRGAVRIMWAGLSNVRYYPGTRIPDETTQPTI